MGSAPSIGKPGGGGGPPQPPGAVQQGLQGVPGLGQPEQGPPPPPGCAIHTKLINTNKIEAKNFLFCIPIKSFIAKKSIKSIF